MTIFQPVTREDRAGAKRSGKKQTSLRARLALGTALATIAFGYAGRVAYAGVCTGSGGVFTCSGADNAGSDVTQIKVGSPLSVTTAAGFGIDTYVSGGNALTLTGTGGMTFTDNNNSLIKAENRGISAVNYSSGNMSITTTGAVSGDLYSGIRAFNNTGTANLSVSVATVSGGQTALDAENRGSGSLTVTTTGAVTATGAFGDGIQAFLNSATGTDLTVTTESTVTGKTQGIDVRNLGTGVIEVTATGAVQGGSQQGIFANNFNGGDVTISAASVSGGFAGINAERTGGSGSGAVSVATTGDVSSTIEEGIRAYNTVSGTTMTISAHNVYGAADGIYAKHLGSGASTITVTGTVTGGSNAGSAGIDTRTGSGGTTNVTLNSGASVSATSGNAIVNDDGNSTVNVNAGASVTGTIVLGAGSDALTFNGGNFSGVTSFDGGTGTDSLTFRSVTGTVAGGNVTGMESVVVDTGSDVTFTGTLTTGQLTANNTGSGALKVTSTGTVTGTTGDGVKASNSFNGTDMTLNLGVVTGAEDGIDATNSGSGAMNISASGVVSGGAGYRGINSNNFGTDMTISVAAVEGDIDGVRAQNTGSGALDITATGTVTTTTGTGIIAINQTGATDVEVSATDVNAGGVGVAVTNDGTGSLTITATGLVNGAGGSGIFANNNNTGLSGTTTVSAHDVTSDTNSAISVNHDGAGALSVTVDGTVTGGGVGRAISITNVGSGTTSITLNSGASVSATSGDAIFDSGTAGVATVTVNSGASVTGTIKLQGGNDALIFSGGAFSSVTSFDGGSGTDSLSFNGSSGTLAGGTVVNMESVSIGLGSNISVSGTLDTGTVTVIGTLGGSGLLNADVSVQAGGTLGPGNSPGLMTIVGNLDLDVSSTTLIEIAGLTAGSQYDRIDVADDPGTGATVEGIATLVAGAFFDIDFFGGFNGGLGDVGLGDFFDVLVADDIVGNVGTLNFNFSGALLGAGLLWDASIVTISGGADDGREALRLSVVEGDAPPLPLATPTSLPLMLAGLLGMVGLGRGRRRRGG